MKMKKVWTAKCLPEKLHPTSRIHKNTTESIYLFFALEAKPMQQEHERQEQQLNHPNTTLCHEQN
jgi:hypothetical protein